MITTTNKRVVLIDDDADFLDGMRRILVSSGIRNVAPFSNGVDAFASLEKDGASAIILDMVMPGTGGRDLLPLLMERYPEIPVIISSAVNEVENVVACMKTGAYDYLVKPIDTSRMIAAVNNALRLNELNLENRRLKEYLLGQPLSNPDMFSGIVTCDARMKAIFKLVETFAPTLYPVLVTGETGVGKEMIARVIHTASGVKGEFVPFNAGGLSTGMFIDTLFGHQQGSHQYGAEERGGLIRKAQGGTLFLDEVGDLGSDSQIALLRLLQEGEYYRPGSDMLFRSNARIITASNRDLKVLMAEGRFRQDLYHRLSSHHIHIPPLRERLDDIQPLMHHFAKIEADHLGKPVPEISQGLASAALCHDYTGNVRELINIVRNGVALNKTGLLVPEDFPELHHVKKMPPAVVRMTSEESYTLHAVFERFPSLEEFERVIMNEALRVSGGNKATAADLLGITRPTLSKKLAAAE